MLTFVIVLMSVGIVISIIYILSTSSSNKAKSTYTYRGPTEEEKRREGALIRARRAIDPDSGLFLSGSSSFVGTDYTPKEIEDALAQANLEFRLRWGGAGHKAMERIQREELANRRKLFGESEPDLGSDSEPYGPGDWQ